MASGNITEISSSPITTLHGYSSGAQTVGWTTEIHPTYAPELQIAGAAFGGLIPNLTALVELQGFHNGERASFGPPVMLGLSHDFSNLSQWLDNNLVPERATEYRQAEHSCYEGNSKYSNKDIGSYFKNGYDSVFEAVPASVLRTSGMWMIFDATSCD
jgi:hypothetical protein